MDGKGANCFMVLVLILFILAMQYYFILCMSMGIGTGYRLQDLPVGIGMIMQLIHVKYEYCFNIQGVIVATFGIINLTL